MISPWTEPGTKVVVAATTTAPLPALQKGLVVVVSAMVVDCVTDSSTFGEVGVEIKGINHELNYPNPRYRWWKFGCRKTIKYIYSRRDFNHIVEEEKREALPESVTRLLDTKLPEVVG